MKRIANIFSIHSDFSTSCNGYQSLLRAIEEEEAKVPSDTRFVSASCQGEKCSVCGEPATNKLEETIFHDDPHKMRHNLTAYVCRNHFRLIVGNLG